MKKERYNKNIKEENPFLANSLKETFSSSMTTYKSNKSIFFRPNNYRRQIEVKTKDNSTIKKITSAIQKANMNNHTKIISIKGYEGITIQYGKNILTGIYSQPKIGNDKLTYFIERNTIQELNERIDEIRKEIESQIDTALNKFINTFKIRLRSKKPSWSRYEDFIKKESFIDSIPRDTIIHDTIFKKVYGKGIEFISTKKGEQPTVNLKNYITNRAIEDISPEITNEINNIHNTIQTDLNPILKEFTTQIKLHLKVQQATLNTLNSMDNHFKNQTPKTILKRGFTTKEMQLIEEFKQGI